LHNAQRFLHFAHPHFALGQLAQNHQAVRVGQDFEQAASLPGGLLHILQAQRNFIHQGAPQLIFS
jgi:hypothetical protein